jgi:hypothetical protein
VPVPTVQLSATGYSCTKTHRTRLQILPEKDHTRVGRALLFVAKTITTGHTGLYTPIKQGHGRGYAAPSRVQCYLESSIMSRSIRSSTEGESSRPNCTGTGNDRHRPPLNQGKRGSRRARPGTTPVAATFPAFRSRFVHAGAHVQRRTRAEKGGKRTNSFSFSPMIPSARSGRHPRSSPFPAPSLRRRPAPRNGARVAPSSPLPVRSAGRQAGRGKSQPGDAVVATTTTERRASRARGPGRHPGEELECPSKELAEQPWPLVII